MSNTNSEEVRNVDVVRRGFEAFAAGDVETLGTLFAPDARWHHAPLGVFDGDYRGSQAILEFLGRLAHETAGTFRAIPVSMAPHGDRVFVLYRATGTRNGKTLDLDDINVFTLTDGAFTKVATFYSDYATEAAFWS